MPFAKVYPLYVTKVERKGRTKDELDEVIRWLLHVDQGELQRYVNDETTFTELFDEIELNPASAQITGMICGMRVETIEDPLMQKIRYLDKVVDELAQGKTVEKVIGPRQARR
jgi:hypothetical protein